MSIAKYILVYLPIMVFVLLTSHYRDNPTLYNSQAALMGIWLLCMCWLAAGILHDKKDYAFKWFAGAILLYMIFGIMIDEYCYYIHLKLRVDTPFSPMANNPVKIGMFLLSHVGAVYLAFKERKKRSILW